VGGVIRECEEISETSRGGNGAVTQSLFYLPTQSKKITIKFLGEGGYFTTLSVARLYSGGMIYYHVLKKMLRIFYTPCRPYRLSNGYWWLFPRIYSGREREADYSPPPCAEVGNSAAIPPLPHTFSWRCAHLIRHRSNFISHSFVHFKRGSMKR
jgi:hypothetical protein